MVQLGASVDGLACGRAEQAFNGEADMSSFETIDEETMLPDLIAAYPQTRGVFDGYGLRGCGGVRGPVESLRFFARTHAVDESRLLREVRQAVVEPTVTAMASDPVADTIYRRFFMGGIAAILTVGAVWGAWLLWKIGILGGFTAVSIHEVNAHGHAQIFGWVILFVMGFAYQALPRMWHTTLPAPRLAAAVFAAMFLAVGVRTTGMAMAHGGTWAVAAAMAGAAVQVVAIVVFSAQVFVAFHRSGKRIEPYVAFIGAALVWMFIQAVFGTWHTWNTMTAPTREQMLHYVATYQAVLRDLQIHGLALFMILGVSLHMLPALFNVPRTPTRRAWLAWTVLMLAVIGESVLFLVYRFTDSTYWAAMLMLPWLMLAWGVWLVAGPWRLWRALPAHDRSGKFVRAGYGWLAVSLIMLLLLPVYQLISGIAFSHAYYGAIRHAITVGFISLMIMGFAAKVTATLNGLDTRRLTALWGPFVLVNLGCFLRVSTQTLTDFHGSFFAVVGISGTLEVAGLAWWGAHLLAMMRQGKRATDDGCLAEPPPEQVQAHHAVAQVLSWYPQTERIFVEYGFIAVRNALLRRTVARTVSIGQACRFMHKDVQAFLADLNKAVHLGAQLRVMNDSSAVR